MPTVTIDGQDYPFEQGERVLQFCLDHGIEIPHFCYHPALTAPANCRQCYVKAGTPLRDRASGDLVLEDDGSPKINWFPKMMPGCVLDLADGMVVETHLSNADVAQAQADTMEMMLINHPLDCPICDQAGQCPLQIQAYKYGPEGSRFEFEKVHKPKRVQLGPNVILDAERCINCTRCTRFTAEVSESYQLSIVNRGDKNYPMTAPGEVFDDPYSMNVCDICPVGALTEDYFRFKARVWEMSKTPSVSDFGGLGINVTYWVKDNQVLRITPRANPDVNDFWMPDAARLVFDRYNTNRPPGPAVRQGSGDGAPRATITAWHQAYDRAAEVLKEAGGDVVFVGSAFATVEDNHLLAKLAEAVGAEAPVYLARREEGSGDGWLVSDDPAPNTQGVERLGFSALDPATFRTRVAGAKALYVLAEDPVAAGILEDDDLDGVSVIVHPFHATNETLDYADVALPLAMTVETIGTFVNQNGRAQRIRPAKAIRGVHRPLMMEMGVSRLDRQGTPYDRWHDESNKVDCQPGWVSVPEVAQRLGHAIGYKSPAAIMDALAQTPAFSGATYAAMDQAGHALEDTAEPA